MSLGSSKRIWWLVPTVCAAVGLIAGASLTLLLDFPVRFATKEGLAIALSLLAASSQVLWLLGAYPTRVGIILYAAAVGLAAGCLGAWLHEVLHGWLLLPREKAAFEGWLSACNTVRWAAYPLVIASFSIILAMARRLAETEKRYALQQDAAALLKDAELLKLRQQLQPHFLFNSLNAVAALIVTAPNKAGEMVSRLADFLRTAVRQGASERVPLAEELDYLRQYLWIEAVRFGDRLRIEWAGDESLPEGRQALMPPFLLQPLMENAIRFGVYGNTGAVTISIIIEQSSELLRITIRNPYEPAMKAAPGAGFGLEGIRRRLWLVYARQDLLHTQEGGGHFTTTLTIPQ